MLGTIVNTCAIVAGCCVGGLLRRGLRPKLRDAMFDALGLVSLAIGFNAVCANMPQSGHPLLFVLSISLGGLAGTALDLDGRVRRLVDRLRAPGSGADGGRPRLSDGLTTAVLLYCVGTLSILGPVNSALLNDNAFLYTNAALDFVSSIIFASTYGMGMSLAAPVLFCWQGGIYLMARLCAGAVPPGLLCETGIVGGALIVASGLSILRVRDIRTLNLLPALLGPALFFLLRSLL